MKINTQIFEYVVISSWSRRPRILAKPVNTTLASLLSFSLLIMAAIILILSPMDMPPPAFASHCAISSGNSNNSFGGIVHHPGGFNGTEIAVKSDLWNYNPSPVFTDTSFWVMLWNDSTYYAQVGWGKESVDSVEYIFAEYKNGGSAIRKYYNQSTGQWGSTKSAPPTSSSTYQVTWVDNAGPPHQVSMQWGNGNPLTANVAFGIRGYEVLAETHDFAINNPLPFKGSHTAGDRSNRIHADYIKYKDSTGWHDAVQPLEFTNQTGNHETDKNSVSGVGFRVWDGRCDD